MGIRSHTAATKAALALAILLTAAVNVSTPPAMGQPVALTTRQSNALDTYTYALSNFKSILRERRSEIDSNQRLPNLPGQALYLARIDVSVRSGLATGQEPVSDTHAPERPPPH
jgi:hypothetical protein